MVNLVWFFFAAALEIGACYTFWMWLRMGRSPVWLVAGLLGLALFAIILTRVEAEFAGRAYAAYGGVYIVAAFLWLLIVEQARPTAADALGLALCLIGSMILLFGPRFS